MSGNHEECRPGTWADWEKRKRTNSPKLLGNFAKNCQFCAHCTWLTVGKTNEFYCHRSYGDKRVVLDMTGKLPEECEKFELRSVYANSNQS